MENQNEYAIILWHNDRVMQVRTLTADIDYVKEEASYVKSLEGTQITDVSIIKTVRHNMKDR
jgi:hypothetical protein